MGTQNYYPRFLIPISISAIHYECDAAGIFNEKPTDLEFTLNQAFDEDSSYSIEAVTVPQLNGKSYFV
jgi:hypothetical protein